LALVDGCATNRIPSARDSLGIDINADREKANRPSAVPATICSPRCTPGGSHRTAPGVRPGVGSLTRVDTNNADRGPLLIIDGEKDHTVPWAIAAYKRQRRNPGVTEIVKIPNRGHALTIDHGWREVAQPALDFVKRFAPVCDSSVGLGGASGCG
jgi:pimeloyl-ACP methyl ester carboxylesterase